jgi:hypothetical protein
MLDRLITAVITIVLWEYRFEILDLIYSLMRML